MRRLFFSVALFVLGVSCVGPEAEASKRRLKRQFRNATVKPMRMWAPRVWWRHQAECAPSGNGYCSSGSYPDICPHYPIGPDPENPSLNIYFAEIHYGGTDCYDTLIATDYLVGLYDWPLMCGDPGCLSGFSYANRVFSGHADYVPLDFDPLTALPEGEARDLTTVEPTREYFRFRDVSPFRSERCVMVFTVRHPRLKDPKTGEPRSIRYGHEVSPRDLENAGITPVPVADVRPARSLPGTEPTHSLAYVQQTAPGKGLGFIVFLKR